MMRELRAMNINDAHAYMRDAFARIDMMNDDLNECDNSIELIDSHDDSIIIDDAFIRAHAQYSHDALNHYASHDDANAIDRNDARCIKYCINQINCNACID